MMKGHGVGDVPGVARVGSVCDAKCGGCGGGGCAWCWCWCVVFGVRKRIGGVGGTKHFADGRGKGVGEEGVYP